MPLHNAQTEVFSNPKLDSANGRTEKKAPTNPVLIINSRSMASFLLMVNLSLNRNVATIAANPTNATVT